MKIIYSFITSFPAVLKRTAAKGKGKGALFGAFTQGFIKNLCDSFKRGKKETSLHELNCLA
jgi:hypothetical protein